jgi:hypothetical protein
LKLFLAQWFEGFHEFHLSHRGTGEAHAFKVWDLDAGEAFLSPEETLSLFHQAAEILTSYLDVDSFKEIYPWHHAAGDFVLCRQEAGVEVRMITVRGYRALSEFGSDPKEKWIGIAHFFLNLTLRMRIDRLDGTGELVWAGPECLGGVVSGFLAAWDRKAKKTPSLPSTEDVLLLFSSFTPEEWLPLAELVLQNGLVEEDELHFLPPQLDEHIISLTRFLREEAAKGIRA